MRITFVHVGLVALFAAACAKGGQATGDDAPIDASPVDHHDAHPMTIVPDSSLPKDASVLPIDASVMVDAAPLGPDASTDGMLCTMNSQCTDAGECCLSINGVGFCAPGILIGSTCLPN